MMIVREYHFCIEKVFLYYTKEYIKGEIVKMTLTIKILSGLLAIISSICFIISNFKKTKKEITALYVITNICAFIRYILTGGKTGIANSFANICKYMAYSKFNSYSFTVLFAIFRITLLCFGYEGILTLLFIILEIIGTAVLLKGTTQQFRIITLVRQVVWTLYDWVFATPFIAFLTATQLISCIISVTKNYKVPRRNKLSVEQGVDME